MKANGDLWFTNMVCVANVVGQLATDHYIL